MKLTTTQRALLSTSLQRDGTIALPLNLKGGAAQKVVSKLLAEGLIEEIPSLAEKRRVKNVLPCPSG